MARFGGNEFTRFSVPLVFRGRYFVLEPGQPPLLTVFVEHDGTPEFEVLRNQPVDNSHSDVSRSPAGIVTVSDRETGRFLYKIRPGSETSVAFGTLRGGEVSARISDRALSVGSITLENNTFDGVMAGVVVDGDGGVGIGCALPPAVAALLTTD
jgi:hypothetical protein